MAEGAFGMPGVEPVPEDRTSSAKHFAAVVTADSAARDKAHVRELHDSEPA